MAARHPDKHFLWIDIEDQADVVSDFDVENFPTLLIQRGDVVAFFGSVMPEPKQADRLLLAQTSKSDEELIGETSGSFEKKNWQVENNLSRCLSDALDD